MFPCLSVRHFCLPFANVVSADGISVAFPMLGVSVVYCNETPAIGSIFPGGDHKKTYPIPGEAVA
jgi:hypothetical protein